MISLENTNKAKNSVDEWPVFVSFATGFLCESIYTSINESIVTSLIEFSCSDFRFLVLAGKSVPNNKYIGIILS